MTDRMTMNDRMDAEMNKLAAPRRLDDSDRNIMADLAGEADEPCAVCETPVRPSLRGGLSRIEEYWEYTDADGNPVCEECVETPCRNCDKPTSGAYCSNLCEDMDRHPAPRDDMERFTGRGPGG